VVYCFDVSLTSATAGAAVSDHSWYWWLPQGISTDHHRGSHIVSFSISVSDFGVSIFVEIRGCHFNLLSLRLILKPYIKAEAKIKAIPLNV